MIYINIVMDKKQKK